MVIYILKKIISRTVEPTESVVDDSPVRSKSESRFRFKTLINFDLYILSLEELIMSFDESNEFKTYLSSKYFELVK